MARNKSPLEPIIEDFIRHHPLAKDWQPAERRAFVRAMAEFLETRAELVQRPVPFDELIGRPAPAKPHKKGEQS